MNFSDLWACSKCGLVYNAPVNNGVCLSVYSMNEPDTRQTFGRPTPCMGTVRPINYKPPAKDERQIDLEDAIDVERTSP